MTTIQTSSPIPTENILIAKYSIEVWLIERDIFEFYQSSSYLFNLDKEQFSFTVEFSKLIFTYWTNNKSESWQIITYKIKNNLLYFDVYVPFSKRVMNLFLKGIDKQANFHGTIIDRKGYLSCFCSLIKQEFPNLKIEKASINDGVRLNYQVGVARLLLSQNELLIAAVGISSYEKTCNLPTLLAEGLKWSCVLGNRFKPISINKLMIFAPVKIVTLLAERLTLITQGQQKIELFEVDEVQNTILPVNPFDQGDLGLSLARDIKLLTTKSKQNTSSNTYDIDEQIDWIKSLAPSLVEIKSNYNKNKLSLHINGLTFATAYLGQYSYIKFGNQERLSLENRIKLQGLVKEIAFYRHSNSPNKQHLYYRTAGELWLETILSRDLACLDPTLLKYCFYRQVLVTKQNHKFIDLLAVDSEGQLVIIELKTVEDIDLPFQALDYWLRIEWYRLRGDLSGKGYFPGTMLKNSPAKVYLVTPRLRCHQEFNFLASLVDKRVPLYYIAINDNWREELKIESRQKIN